MKNFLNWLLTSSNDPTKFALTAKGFALLGGGYLVHAVALACAFGLYCLNVDNEVINQVATIVYDFVYGGMLVIGALAAAYGLLRKLAYGRWSHPDASVL
jgi:hypothetical protein